MDKTSNVTGRMAGITNRVKRGGVSGIYEFRLN